MGGEISKTVDRSTPVGVQLRAILDKHPWLNSDNHQLNPLIKQLYDAINGKTDSDPYDLLERLLMELNSEKETLSRAFKLFDTRKQKALNSQDLKNMQRYLGFPSDDADIKEIMAVIDKDKSGSINEEEFANYVGRMGGSMKLFEERQKRFEARDGRASMTASDVAESVVVKLNQCSIDPEAQAYWKMVVPPSELITMTKLVPCQQNAISTIRKLAKKNHQEALPKLQKRMAQMGYPEDNLWLTLAWIRELAPIILHVNLDKILQYLEKDTYYRNQFETNTSGGLLKPEVRKKWERDLFSGAYDQAQGFDRPKYGVQNVMNDHRGVVKCAQYGDSYLILKDVRLRCTFSPEDSANLKADKLAVLDFYAHVLQEYSTDELRETVKVANSADAALLGDSGKVGSMKYKEAQIHGEVSLANNVERLVANTRHRGKPEASRIKAMCDRHGFGFTWMDEEQKRMETEMMHKLGGAEWKERLDRLQADGGDIAVPEGFCKVGCGRKVMPGVTRSGKPFTTCCRGCIMGFGHDLRCQNVDPSKVGPGMCKQGCGRRVAPGVDKTGRPLTTCCRSCATDITGNPTHDATCNMPIVPGMCKMGCGRKVAESKPPGGRTYTTCCRGCALGQGHTDDCGS